VDCAHRQTVFKKSLSASQQANSPQVPGSFRDYPGIPCILCGYPLRQSWLNQPIFSGGKNPVRFGAALKGLFFEKAQHLALICPGQRQIQPENVVLSKYTIES
jgi:hypothetical protein